MAVCEMRLAHDQFNLVQQGTKTVECRLNDPKRRQLHVGDTLIFTDSQTGAQLSTILTTISCFDSFYRLFQHFPKVAVGSCPQDRLAQQCADMVTIYSAMQERRWGVVGLTIRRC